MSTTELVELFVVLAAVAAFTAVIVLLLHAGGGGSGPQPADRRPGKVMGRKRGRRRLYATDPEPVAAEPEDRPLPAVVVNPTKFDDVGPLREQITTVCTDLGWAEPLWLETTAEDPGVGQTHDAVRQGADIVLACGGDGTVRCVGQALAGTGVPIGLLPAGTGNLLARNLDFGLDDMSGAVRDALSGDDRPIDVGRVVVDDESEERVFLVMAGLGFDAAIMAGAPEGLKARVGPLAYIVSGLRLLKGESARVRLAVDDEPEQRRRIRTVVIGNCGKLLGGLELMPNAEVDDGWLDVVSIAPQGLAGWGAVALRVFTKQRKGHRRVEHWTAQAITISSDTHQPAQLDGDPIGDVRTLRLRVDPGALLVRVPAAAVAPSAS